MGDKLFQKGFGKALNKKLRNKPEENKSTFPYNTIKKLKEAEKKRLERLRPRKKDVKKIKRTKFGSDGTIPLIGAGAGVAGAKGLRSQLSKLGAGAGVAAGKGLRSKLSKLGQTPKQTTNRRTEARNQANQKMKTTRTMTPQQMKQMEKIKKTLKDQITTSRKRR